MSLAGQIVYSTAVSDVNDKLMDFCCFLLFSAISMILLKKLCQFCATGVKSSAFCINISHLQFIQLWNTTNFSTLYSVQNRFFSTRLRQYGLLSRHLSTQHQTVSQWWPIKITYAFWTSTFMFLTDLLQQSYFSKLRWPQICGRSNDDKIHIGVYGLHVQRCYQG